MDAPPPPPALPLPPPLLPPLITPLGLPTNNEWTSFFESLVAQFPQSEKEKVYTLICNNHLDNFRVKTLTVKLEDNTYKASIHYLVIHCDGDTTLTYDFPTTFVSIMDVLKAFYTLLWTSTLCSECFDIITMPSTLCSQCYPMRIMHHFGMAHNHTLYIPTCPICFEQVYSAKLHCGHYVHKTCFIKMNSERWFTYETEVKCPLCRAEITTQDKYDYFLWYG
jgi:hypothetical protein